MEVISHQNKSLYFVKIMELKIQFSVARTPQRNGVVERKNRTLEEMARTMLKYSKLSNIFWVQAVHTIVHILNRGILRSNSDKIPYDLWKGMPMNVKHFRVFGRKFYIKGEDNIIENFDSGVDKGILVGYSRKIKECNLRPNIIVEIINVNIDQTNMFNTREESRNSKEREAEEEELKEEEV